MILIFTEALSTTGLGHLGRCTALAEILIEAGNKVEMILDSDGTGVGEESLFPMEINNWKNLHELLPIFKLRKPDFVFVDSYLASSNIYQEIANNVSKLICLDDINRIEYPINSLILNPGFGGRYIEYSIDRSRILTGPEYVLLRKPFREDFDYPPIKENIETVLITVGGDDRRNLVPKILESINSVNPTWKKEVIVGPSFDNIEEIKKQCDLDTSLHQSLSALQIRELMLKVDIAITAGGQTTYELAKCGIPMIILEIVENQKENIKGFLHENLAVTVNLHMHNENSFKPMLDKMLEKIATREARYGYKDRCIKFFQSFNSRNLYNAIV